MPEFKEWPKIPRGGNGELITITEKIDGTNACIIIEEDPGSEFREPHLFVAGVQSRTRLITPDADNYGFAQWVKNYEEELLKLGPGYHYGEWAGPGIQNNPHKLERKTLFLFNSERWRDGRQQRPEKVECVPILYEGELVTNWQGQTSIDEAMIKLRDDAEVKGYEPEGVVVWYHKTRRYEKYTFKNTGGKWQNAS